MTFLVRPGADVFYQVAGHGPAIVFAHGLGGNHISWWQQVPAFAEHSTCVVFAARGFAPSRVSTPLPADASLVDAFVDDLAALIEELGLDEVSLVAQSLGGWTCLEYALAHPERVRGLVLADTTGTVRPTAQTDPAESHRLRALGIHPACGERMAREQPALHELYRSLDALSFDLDKDAVRAASLAARVRDLGAVAALSMPVLGIAGAEDVLIAPGAVRAMAQAMPHGCYEEIPASGHSVYFERPETFNRLAGEFLRSV